MNSNQDAFAGFDEVVGSLEEIRRTSSASRRREGHGSFDDVSRGKRSHRFFLRLPRLSRYFPKRRPGRFR